jgi:carbamate kinase
LRVVIALGGNALLRRHDPPDAEVQRRNIALAAEAIAALDREHTVVVTHGNGPQIGFLAMQAASRDGIPPRSLDELGAESQGLIGYMIEQAVANLLPHRNVATLLTRVEVDAGDPAFQNPQKPIGPLVDEARARTLSAEQGWTMARDDIGFRRVVASPEPRRIVELPAILALLEAKFLIICAGGGGIPVTAERSDTLHGIEAVIDKDLSAALLAIALRADRLVMLTDVPGVFADWPSREHLIRTAHPDALAPEQFAAGTMRPKIEAARRFAAHTGGAAQIGALDDAARVIAGAAGTTIAAGASRTMQYSEEAETPGRAPA